MANQVEIFNIEFGDTLQSIEKLKAELKETKKLFETAKPNTAEFVKYSTEVKRLDGTIKALNGATKENQNALGGINNAAKFASGSYGELKQRIEAQKKALLELNTNSQEFIDTQEELIKLQNQRIEIEKKIPSLFQERIKGAIDESNALKQLRIDLKAAQSAALNGDGAAAQRVAELKDKIDDLKDSTKSLQGSGVERLNTSMNLLTQGFADFDADKVKTGFKGIGAAMSAIPIVLIIEGIKALIDNFDEVVKFAKNLTGSFSAAEKNVRDLTIATEKETVANRGLINAYTNEIALLTAKGGHEKEIIELKKKKIAIEIAEAENTVRLNAAKVAEAILNNSITDSVNNLTIALFRKVGATETADKLDAIQSKVRKARIIEEQKDNLKAIEDAKLAIQTSKNELLIIDVEYNKKQVEATKEKNKELVDLEKDRQAREAEVFNAQIDREDALIQKSKQRQIDANNALIDLEIQLLENLKSLDEQRLQDKIAIANTELIQKVYDNETFLALNQQLLDAKMEQELSNEELTQAQRAEIQAKYAQQSEQLTYQTNSDNLAAAANLTDSLATLSDGLFALKRANLEKGSEEDKKAAEQQFNINKALSITTAIINGASAVMNALGTVQPYYLAVAAAVGAGITTAGQVAKISSQKFKYFDGGFTSKGDPKQEAQSIGNAQFHNDEYVVPSKVKNKSEAVPHITALEKMRKGYSPSGISGFFDGGFTSRSASSSTEMTASNQNNLMEFIKSIPNPVVKVTDIIKVTKSNDVGVSVSSL